MKSAKPVILLAVVAVLGTAGCARKDGGLMNLRATSNGPDEFAILPTQPLTQPKSYTDLPEPTPGSANLTDPTPLVDASVVLGGSRKQILRSGIPRSDQGLINVASRYGVSGNIRSVLAAEDLEFRDKNRGKILERMFGTTVYFSAYKPQTLDRYAELERLRRLGYRTSAAPPQTTN